MPLVRKETLYEILCLSRSATLPELEFQFSNLQEFWERLSVDSPREAELKLTELRNAYAILSNPENRSEYDNGLDFEFVLLDGKIKDPEMEQAYDVYRHNHQKTYHEILRDFSFFKDELSDTLWKLKSTTLFLISSLFFYSGLILLVTFILESNKINIEDSFPLRILFVPIYIFFSGFTYWLLQKFYQVPALKKRKAARKSRSNF